MADEETEFKEQLEKIQDQIDALIEQVKGAHLTLAAPVGPEWFATGPGGDAARSGAVAAAESLKKKEKELAMLIVKREQLQTEHIATDGLPEDCRAPASSPVDINTSNFWFGNAPDGKPVCNGVELMSRDSLIKPVFRHPKSYLTNFDKVDFVSFKVPREFGISFKKAESTHENIKHLMEDVIGKNSNIKFGVWWFTSIFDSSGKAATIARAKSTAEKAARAANWIEEQMSDDYKTAHGNKNLVTLVVNGEKGSWGTHQKETGRLALKVAKKNGLDLNGIIESWETLVFEYKKRRPQDLIMYQGFSTDFLRSTMNHKLETAEQVKFVKMFDIWGPLLFAGPAGKKWPRDWKLAKKAKRPFWPLLHSGGKNKSDSDATFKTPKQYYDVQRQYPCNGVFKWLAMPDRSYMMNESNNSNPDMLKFMTEMRRRTTANSLIKDPKDPAIWPVTLEMLKSILEKGES